MFDTRDWLRSNASFRNLESSHPEVAEQIIQVIDEATLDIDPLLPDTDYWETLAAKLVVQLGILRAHVRRTRRESLH